MADYTLGKTGAQIDAIHLKVDGIEALADVTDTANVTAAGALMDSEVTNLAAVKSFDPSDYATAAQGTLADSAQQPPAEGAFVDGDKTKLDGVETGATADQTGAEIKAAYEGEADTNAFTDAEQTKLSGVATGATANSADATLLNRANHTGTQTLSTISDAGAVASKGVTGLDTNAVTGTSGSANFDAVWNADGDLVSDDDKLLFAAALSDETTDLTVGEKFATDVPRNCTITRIYVSVTTAAAGANLQVDVEDEGTTILNAVFSFTTNNAETSTFTGAASSYSFTKGDLLTVDVDQIGSTTAGAGLKVFFHGYWT